MSCDAGFNSSERFELFMWLTVVDCQTVCCGVPMLTAADEKQMIIAN